MSHEDRAAVEIATVRTAGERIRAIEAAMQEDPRPRVWWAWDAFGEDAQRTETRSGAAEAALAFGVAQRANRRAERYLDAAWASATDRADRERVERLRSDLAEAWTAAEVADRMIRDRAGMLGW